jgi:hypothetical protein
MRLSYNTETRKPPWPGMVTKHEAALEKRKIILHTATSLDGMIAREDGGIDRWGSDQQYGCTSF